MDKAGRNRKIGGVTAAIGAFLMLAAVVLTLYNFWDEARAEKDAGNVLEEILDEMEGSETIDAAPAENDTGKEDGGAQIDWSEEANMPTVVLDGADYVGILEIPALGLALPVRDEWSYPNLRKTPCRYTGGMYSHDMVIAGHNYDSHFGRLKTLQIGDEVYFTDIDENRVEYYVSEIDTLSPTDIEKMTAIGEWDLTLFTCTVGGKSRVTVRCTMRL